MRKIILTAIIIAINIATSFANRVLIPMDLAQNDHLKAYGLIYWQLTNHNKVDWLLNYRSGSFMTDYSQEFIAEARIRGVSFEILSDDEAESIVAMIKKDDVNMDDVVLEKAPRIGVYVTPGI